jgi:hypothetical protein
MIAHGRAVYEEAVADGLLADLAREPGKEDRAEDRAEDGAA